MILQISAGMGPVECQRAVFGICKALMREFQSLESLSYVDGEENDERNSFTGDFKLCSRSRR